MKKIIFFLTALMTVSFYLSAQEASNEALGFSALDYGTVSLSMAGASLTDTTSVSYAALGNSAMIPISQKKLDASASYMSLTPSSYKTNVISVGVSGRIKKFGIALGFVNSTGPEVNKFQEKDMLLGIGLAYKFTDFLSLGVNGRYAKQTFSDKYSYGAFMADVNLGGKVKGFGYSLGVSGLGGKVTSGKNSYSLPTSLSAGFGYDAVLGEKSVLQAHLDADYYFSSNFAAALGLQYSFNDMIFARAGYRMGGKSVVPSYGSVGLGFKIKGIHIDAGYLFGNTNLKNTISASIGYCF
mgnify:CR=1 FL=1